MPNDGIGKVHKDVTAYGRSLISDGWDDAGTDQFGNLRFRWPATGAVVTVPRSGTGRWRNDVARQVATIAGRPVSRRRTPRRLALIADSRTVERNVPMVVVSPREPSPRLPDAEIRRLEAAERKRWFYQDLMRAPR